MAEQETTSPGFRISDPVNLAERLSRIHLAVELNYPTNPFKVEVSVLIGPMPLTFDNRNYVIEARRLFVSYREAGCELVPHACLQQQKITGEAEDRRVHSKFKVGANVKLPGVKAKGSYESSSEVEASDNSHRQQTPPLIARAKLVSGGWELWSVEPSGEPSRHRPLPGIMLSGVDGKRTPVGTFKFAEGKKVATIRFAVRLPRGCLNLAYADRGYLSPGRREKKRAETALGSKLVDNFEAMKSRIAGLCVEHAEKLINRHGRDEETGELILSIGAIEAFLEDDRGSAGGPGAASPLNESKDG